jgi:hypothetical protein
MLNCGSFDNFLKVVKAISLYWFQLQTEASGKTYR